MKRVGIAELKDQLSIHLRSVEAGETVEITDRARPMARIVPIAGTRAITIRPARRLFASVRDLPFSPLGGPRLADDLLAVERGERADHAEPRERPESPDPSPRS
ncbi:MAG: type II toxin-antitoxin system prevent-host-death family antitoxin [Chloroflexota bacterium]